jgi:hypothetical protein
LAKFTGQSVPEIQETANLQILSLQKRLFPSGAFWQRLAGQGEGQGQTCTPPAAAKLSPKVFRGFGTDHNYETSEFLHNTGLALITSVLYHVIAAAILHSELLPAVSHGGTPIHRK